MSRIDTKREQLKEVIALNNNFPFAMLMSSVVLLVASSSECSGDCGGKGEEFAVVASVLMTFFLIIYIYHVYYGIFSERTDVFWAVGLFLAWTVITGFVTFEAPFETPGNGFIAAWIGFVASLGNLVYNVKFADAMKTRFVGQGLYLCLLLVGSIVVVVAAIADGDDANGENGKNILAIVAGSVGFTITLIRVFVGPNYDRLFGVFLTAWWMILGLFLTFGEFEIIGNGFIATWVCMISSVGLLGQAGQRNNPRFSANVQKNQQVNQFEDDGLF